VCVCVCVCVCVFNIHLLECMWAGNKARLSAATVVPIFQSESRVLYNKAQSNLPYTVTLSNLSQ
jgi:hypothetical protein